MTPKFRAWIKSRQQMMEVVCIAYKFSDAGGLDYIISYVEAASDSSRKFTTSEPYFLDDFVLMQSTGLLDCNGKEIYEGDIVFWQWGEIGDNTFTNSGKKIVDSNLQTLVMLSEAERLLVLDNIYENPELLKEIETEKECCAWPDELEDVTHEEEDDSETARRD
ncbi:MAG: YopX family protein [Candidatus Izemoplasmatales bacterium]|nr:YopX family protein [Candidatus Izemoplasmatales bacterium]